MTELAKWFLFPLFLEMFNQYKLEKLLKVEGYRCCMSVRKIKKWISWGYAGKIMADSRIEELKIAVLGKVNEKKELKA